MNRLRIPLFILIGLGIGIALGLLIGWVLWPTEFTDANPAVLQETYRHDYAQMIADGYALDGNLPAAQQRLNDLGDDPEAELLAAITDKVLADGDEAEIRRMVQLAADLGLSAPVMGPFLPEETSP